LPLRRCGGQLRGQTERAPIGVDGGLEGIGRGRRTGRLLTKGVNEAEILSFHRESV